MPLTSSTKHFMKLKNVFSPVRIEPEKSVTISFQNSHKAFKLRVNYVHFPIGLYYVKMPETVQLVHVSSDVNWDCTCIISSSFWMLGYILETGALRRGRWEWLWFLLPCWSMLPGISPAVSKSPLLLPYHCLPPESLLSTSPPCPDRCGCSSPLVI